MFFKSAFAFITFILEGLFRFVFWLLSFFRLWIPALYSLLFLLVCLITRTPFSDLLGIYLFGLAITVLFSLAITAAEVFHEKKKESEGGDRFLGSVKPKDGSKKQDFAAEKPMVFKTRMDENMVIYEYSDRLEFYRTDGEKLIHLSTETKSRPQQ